MFKRKKFWKRLALTVLISPALIFLITIGILYWKQNEITSHLIKTLNADFKGEIVLGDSHVSPFENFPYISIDLDDVKIYEDKLVHKHPIFNIDFIYLGFDVRDLITGDVIIKSLKLKGGHIDIVQYKNSEFNIANALSSSKKIESSEEEFNLHLVEIDLENIDVTKLNEENELNVETFINKAHASFKTSADHLYIALDSKFLMNIIKGGDTTVIKHKHFDINTRLDYFKKTDVVEISPSEIILEHAVFNMQGKADLRHEMDLDLKFSGEKSNFGLLISFAPENLVPILERYENKGKIFFNATIKGKSVNGHKPEINAEFGCEDAFFVNSESKKRLEEIRFKGYFTNGAEHDLKTMEFGLTNMYAKPEAGVFNGNMVVRNFEKPQVEMRVHSEFNLQYLAKFLNLEELENLDGNVELTVNFDELVDVHLPETSLKKVRQGAQSELKVTNLNFKIPGYHLPIKNINLDASMYDKMVKIEYCNLKAGASDISISGTLDDLPAILNHTDKEVHSNLVVKSSLLDIKELTSFDTAKMKPVDERITNFSAKLAFKTSAQNISGMKNLPVGEFFIEDLFMKLNHYPHTFHDFHADLLIGDNDLKLQNFNGALDQSDFKFSGALSNYNLWFDSVPKGNTKIEYNFSSELLKLKDIFSYKGENYVPEDYRHEELSRVGIHGKTELHFDKKLKSIDTYLEKMGVRFKSHNFKLRRVNGRVHYEDEHLLVEKLSGKMGKSDFTVDMAYYSGKDPTVKKRDNHFHIKSDLLDFDQLTNYTLTPTASNQTTDHEGSFSIYDLPFTDMSIDVDIKQFNYHRYLLTDLKGKLRIQENHYIYIDTLAMNAAGGHFDIKGYFNGSDRNKIYFSPNIRLQHVDLDKLMYKFENFGQDHFVSENLHGEMSGLLTGKIHMHNDLVPVINDSELDFDFSVTHGKVANYAPLNALSAYFKDKDLSQIRFDTLRNKLNLNKGVLTIPDMTINSTLGFLELSGKQDLESNMEYFVRVPLKMVSSVGFSKLFGKKKEEEDEKADDIIYKDPNQKVRYVNLKITGNSTDYKIALGKKN